MNMIIILHILGHGGILDSAERLSLNYEIIFLLETAAFCAVNCYALISGYVGVSSKFKYSGIISLWLQVVFYSVVINTIFAITDKGSVDVKDFFNGLFPVMLKQYWYFTAYFGMFFFIPFFNFLLNNLPKKQLKAFIVSSVLLFSVLPLIFQQDSFRIIQGYSPLWLAVLYIIGGYIKLYRPFNGAKSGKFVLTYFSCVIITWLIEYVLEFYSNDTLTKATTDFYVVKYTSPLILLAAVALLMLFSGFNISKKCAKAIRALSCFSFGVYLIHDNPLIREHLMEDNFISFSSFSPIVTVLLVILSAATIYLLCSVIDFLRICLFCLLRINELSEKIDSKIQKLVSSF